MPGQFDGRQLTRQPLAGELIPVTFEPRDQSPDHTAVLAQLVELLTNGLIGRDRNQKQSERNPADPGGVGDRIPKTADGQEQHEQQEEHEADLSETTILLLELLPLHFDRSQFAADSVPAPIERRSR